MIHNIVEINYRFDYAHIYGALVLSTTFCLTKVWIVTTATNKWDKERLGINGYFWPNFKETLIIHAFCRCAIISEN